MNMKTDFEQLAVKLINSTFGDVAQSVVIRRPLYNNYDEESGALISASEDYTVNGIIGPWVDDNRAATTSGAIRSDDSSLLIASTDLGIVPEVDVDTAITADGTQWAILYVEQDEAQATILCRISKGIEQ